MPQLGNEFLQCIGLRVEFNAYNLSNRRHQPGGVAHLGQVHPPSTVCKRSQISQALRHQGGQRRLAYASHSTQGYAGGALALGQ
ncbi:hypothetical protein HPF_14075 [Hydrogenophaga pseudoflava]|uniref:Uncharacterized protein n=1 Tax=Hydrogenophaga pseudoflava TaxID=47421 RepID=A0A4P6X516_HYDPS|nr:hypothetical protein HPF_14075 [Hydrogenophaga pseudoflava]